MNLDAIAISVLLFLSSLLGISELPEQNEEWVINQSWTKENSYYKFSASSAAIVNHCLKNPSHKLNFPFILHSAHKLYFNNKLLFEFGDASFKSVRSFYGTPSLDCSRFKEAGVLSWDAYSYTRYFARFDEYPRVEKHKSAYNLFGETFNMVAGGALILLSFFSFIIFYKKIPKAKVLSISLSNLFMGIFFIGATGGLYSLPFSMLTTHKFSDVCLWIGMCFFFNSFRLEKLLGIRAFQAYVLNISLAILIILIGDSGDIVQMGTSLPFVWTFVPLFSMLHTLFKQQKGKWDQSSRFRFLSMGIFALCAFNEMFLVLGLIDGVSLLGPGVVLALLSLTLSVNDTILSAYRERNYLRENLQLEVDRKTSLLQAKTQELQTAMSTLKEAQSELVQSAKLASLGTLAAGIAHEINNSINYVNGAIKPLERLIQNDNQLNQNAKVKKLLDVMKDGLNVTVSIIANLRNFTGINKAEYNDIEIKAVIETVLAILNHRVKLVCGVEIDVDRSHCVYGNVVGLNQIFMNLISNALDAIEDSQEVKQLGELKIKSKMIDGEIQISLKDSGSGIEGDKISQIFDPFYTTKEVGKGTGIGLHIVRQEIDKHKGIIKVESNPGEGTEFTVCLPATEDRFNRLSTEISA